MPEDDAAAGFPIAPPIEPMLAKLAAELPAGDGWLFEPKWDGFRAIVFRDHDRLYIQSRDLKPLDRYFPELQPILRASLPARCVVDGEIVIATDRGLDFDALQLRLHPAASRVRKLAAETPASFVAFDVLADGGHDLRSRPQAERRAALEETLARAAGRLHLTPCSRERRLAEEWFVRFEGAGLDGVVAKHESTTYQSGKRAMVKVKHARSADCVVAGFRWHKNGPGTLVGSLLLGLYDDGRCAAPRRRDLVVLDGSPPRSRAGARTAAEGCARGSSLARVGGIERRGSAHARRPQPLERGQGFVVGAAAHRARVRGHLRPSARRPLPPRGRVRALACRQAASRLRLRSARGHSARRARRDLPLRL